MEDVPAVTVKGLFKAAPASATSTQPDTSLLQLERSLLIIGYLMGFFPYWPAKTWATRPFDFKFSLFARLRGLCVIAGLCFCLYLTVNYSVSLFKKTAAEGEGSMSGPSLLCQAAFTVSNLLPCGFAVICAVNNSLYASGEVTDLLLNEMCYVPGCRVSVKISLSPNAL